MGNNENERHVTLVLPGQNLPTTNQKRVMDWQARLTLGIEAVKLIALIAAGVWTVFLYIKIQRNFSDPTIPTLMSTATLEADAQQPGTQQRMLLKIRHQNLGKVDVRVTHVVLRLFYGAIPDQPASGDTPTLVGLNNPPPIGVADNGVGPISWDPIGYKACISPAVISKDDKADIPTDLAGFVFRPGGDCGTGTLRSGTTLEQVIELHYSAGNGKFVGAAAAFVYDNGVKSFQPQITYVTALADAIPAKAENASRQKDMNN